MNTDEEWKKLEHYKDFYKFNWQLVKSLFFIILSLSGAVSGFCLAQGKEHISAYALFIPIITNIFMFIMMTYSLGPIKHNSEKIKVYADAVGMTDMPQLKALTFFMFLIIGVTFLVTSGLITLWFYLK